jgi:hypothetical protein
MHEILHYYDIIAEANDEGDMDAVNNTDNTLTATADIERKQQLTAALQKLGRQFIITTTDKAAACYAVICKRWYMNNIQEKLCTSTYSVCNDTLDTICTNITEQLQKWNIKIDIFKETNKYTEIPHKLPTYFLTLKAHKTPQLVRGVASVSGTIIAALARLLSSAQQLCITTIDEVWCKIAEQCKIACDGSWIISDIAKVPGRVQQAYKFAENWLKEMEVYGFTSMYDKFVHADMKQKLREMTTLVFEYMIGNEILTELNEFTDRRNFKRASGQQFKKIEIIYEPSDSKGITATASANWSEHDSGYPIKNKIRPDADTLCERLDYLIDNSYVAHTGIVYKQVIGMAMGVHNAPQMANLYCAHYELQYVLRRAVHYLTTLKLCESVPATPKDKLLRAEMVSEYRLFR